LKKTSGGHGESEEYVDVFREVVIVLGSRFFDPTKMSMFRLSMIVPA
jgi:hypothetical protein